MNSDQPGLASRAALGAAAGYAATLAMTALMQRLHEHLRATERYPIAPREITARIAPAPTEDATATRTLLAHFGYGAVTGALFGLTSRRVGLIGGAFYGVAVWCASYLGWIPAFGVLKPATEHPPRRNALMITVHLVWGVATAWGLGELIRAHRGAFAGGELKDAPFRAPLSQAEHERGRRALRHLH